MSRIATYGSPNGGGDVEGRIKAIEREAAQLQDNLDRGFELFLQGKVPDEVWQRNSNRWMDHIRTIEHEITSLRGTTNLSAGDVMRFMEAVSNLHQWYLDAERFERAILLKAVTSNLIVGREKIVPVYRKGFQVIADSDWYARQGSNL